MGRGGGEGGERGRGEREGRVPKDIIAMHKILLQVIVEFYQFNNCQNK